MVWRVYVVLVTTSLCQEARTHLILEKENKTFDVLYEDIKVNYLTWNVKQWNTLILMFLMVQCDTCYDLWRAYILNHEKLGGMFLVT